MESEIKMSKDLLNLPLVEVNFVVFDTETSLMSQPDNPAFYDMVEIGCLAFNLKGQEIDSFHSLIKPFYPFNRASCKAMHITESDLETAPSFPEVANPIVNILSNRIIVGQNTQFDIRALKHAIKIYTNKGSITKDLQAQLFSTLELDYIDTKKVFSQLFPKEKQRSLDSISKMVGLNPERTKHSALEDARLTLEVFRKLVELSQPRKVVTLGNLFDLQYGQHGKPKQTSLF